jgi:hypothetical protein
LSVTLLHRLTKPPAEPVRIALRHVWSPFVIVICTASCGWKPVPRKVSGALLAILSDGAVEAAAAASGAAIESPTTTAAMPRMLILEV